MKWLSLRLLTVIFLTAGIGSCKKETVSQAENPPAQPVSQSRAPVAHAGHDMRREIPCNIMLQGSFYDADPNFIKTEWRNVSGPDSSIIVDKDSLKTVVKNLKVGIYQFELTVTDKMNLYGKDTVQVQVVKRKLVDSVEIVIQNHEIIFKNLTWIFPLDNALELINIHKYIPVGTPMKVMLHRGYSTDWVEATPFSNNGSNKLYEYFIETSPNSAGIYTYGSMYVFYYGRDTWDRPDVKVIF